MGLVSVVIPVYKSELNSNEQKSFNRCLKVLKNYPFTIISHRSIDTSYYAIELLTSEVEYYFEYFDDIDFASKDSYNRLLRSLRFFEVFENKFDNILIYQLDSYVFNDELIYWCDKKFDFIGAPWFEGWNIPASNNRLIGVGNGGFSLRRIKSTICILRRIARIELLRKVWRKSFMYLLIDFYKILKSTRFLFCLRKIDLFESFLVDFSGNEDYFWGHNVPFLFYDYKVADINNAIKFSFEVRPSFLYDLNNTQLPFGCHAWEKYEYTTFWKSIIENTRF